MSSTGRAIVVLVLVFVAGGVAGAALERRFETPVTAPAVEARRLPATSREHEAEVDQIPYPLEALGLSEDETRRLHAIARRWRPRASQLIEALRDSVGGFENGMFAEMLCVITTEQRERYLVELRQQTNGADTTLIDRRFRLVRSKQCPDSLGADAAK